MHEGNNMDIMTTLKKPTLERGRAGAVAWGQQRPVQAVKRRQRSNAVAARSGDWIRGLLTHRASAMQG